MGNKLRITEDRRISEPDRHHPPAVETIRDIRLLEQDAPTASYKADRRAVVRLLNAGLAAEIVSVLGYKRHHRMASGVHARSAAADFLELAEKKQSQADLFAAHIVQLGGDVELDLAQISRHRHARFVEGSSLQGMIREDLEAERTAIAGYEEMIRFLGADFPLTRMMVEAMRAGGQGQIDDLTSLLVGPGV